MNLIEITVLGTPVPQGSVKTFVPTRADGSPARRPDGGIIVNVTTDNPALKAWRAKIEDAAKPLGYVTGQPGLVVDVTFYFDRPKAHCGTGRNEGVVKDSAPAYPTVRPDVDKLLRAVLDALSEVTFVDDAQVVEARARKRYVGPGEVPRAVIVVRVCAEQSWADLSPQIALTAASNRGDPPGNGVTFIGNRIVRPPRDS